MLAINCECHTILLLYIIHSKHYYVCAYVFFILVIAITLIFVVKFLCTYSTAFSVYASICYARIISEIIISEKNEGICLKNWVILRNKIGN